MGVLMHISTLLKNISKLFAAYLQTYDSYCIQVRILFITITRIHEHNHDEFSTEIFLNAPFSMERSSWQSLTMDSPHARNKSLPKQVKPCDRSDCTCGVFEPESTSTLKLLSNICEYTLVRAVHITSIEPHVLNLFLFSLIISYESYQRNLHP